MARKNNDEFNDLNKQAVENAANEETQVEKKTIEDWKKELKIKDWVFIGLCEQNNWASGKAVSKDEFNHKVNKFMNSKIGG